MNSEYALAFSAYIGVLGLITFAFYYFKNNQPVPTTTSGHNHAEQEFLLGNRSIGSLATAIAAHSSDMSIWLFTGLPGSVYLFGMQKAWLVVGLTIGMYLCWTFVAEKLRINTEKHESYTLSGYFEEHFQDKTGRIRLFSALFALLFSVFYISSGLVGLGITLESVFGMDYHYGILIGLTITVLYTLIGGFASIAWCDLFQGLFMVFMIVLVPLYGYTFLENGISSITTIAQLKHISLSIIPDTWSELVSYLMLAVGWGLGYFGQPHILVNFMGIKDPSSIKQARTIGMIWQLFAICAVLAVGLIGIGMFPESLVNNELVFVVMVQKLFTPLFAGFILCAIIAAALTTIDTQVLVSATVVSQDLYKRFINPQASSRRTLFVSKLGIILVPTLSFLIAFNRSASVYTLVEYAWMGLGSAFGPVVLVALYSKRVTAKKALIGMIVGGSLAALWPLLNTGIPAMIPAFSTNILLLLFI